MRTWILMMLSATLAFGQTKPADTVQRCRSMLADAAHNKNPDGRKGAAEAFRQALRHRPDMAKARERLAKVTKQP